MGKKKIGTTIKTNKYKIMAKSGFKMKGSPMQRNFGIGASPMRVDPKTAYDTVKDASNSLTKTGQGVDVTAEYTKTGSKSTRDHIASGGKVFRMPDGSLSLTTTTKK